VEEKVPHITTEAKTSR